MISDVTECDFNFHRLFLYCRILSQYLCSSSPSPCDSSRCRCVPDGPGDVPAPVWSCEAEQEEALQEVWRVCVCVCVSAADMKCVSVSVLLCVLWSQTHGVHIRLQNQNSSERLDAAVMADLSAVIRRVDRRFLSVTIDASLASEEKFMYLLRWVQFDTNLPQEQLGLSDPLSSGPTGSDRPPAVRLRKSNESCSNITL